jgi:hypothetical protein
MRFVLVRCLCLDRDYPLSCPLDLLLSLLPALINGFICWHVIPTPTSSAAHRFQADIHPFQTKLSSI